MNTISINTLKSLRRFYRIFKPESNTTGRNWKLFSNKEYSNNMIYEYLISDKPCMIARFGSTELACLTNYIGVKYPKKNYLNFIKGNTLEWWWNNSTFTNMDIASGFFDPTIEKIEMFCELMINDIQQVDILGSWLNEERYFNEQLLKSKRIVLEDLEPFFTKNPWTKALENKKILVVHPFVETMEKQYKKRELIFENNLLPDFELKTIKAVQSVAEAKSEFKDWFEALNYMKSEIDKVDYDICIIGCGAYGLPLAAHVKRSGKKSVHLAGVTQLLFGIKGKRWEDYVVWPYMNLFNEHWVRPGENEKPAGAEKVENACYW